MATHIRLFSRSLELIRFALGMPAAGVVGSAVVHVPIGGSSASDGPVDVAVADVPAEVGLLLYPVDAVPSGSRGGPPRVSIIPHAWYRG